MHLCLFEGAPGPEPAEVSLLYLGDMEISEEATLAELKSQVRPLPAAYFGIDMASSREILIYSSISSSPNYSLSWYGMCYMPWSGVSTNRQPTFNIDTSGICWCCCPVVSTHTVPTGMLCLCLDWSSEACGLCSFWLFRETWLLEPFIKHSL